MGKHPFYIYPVSTWLLITVKPSPSFLTVTISDIPLPYSWLHLHIILLYDTIYLYILLSFPAQLFWRNLSLLITKPRHVYVKWNVNIFTLRTSDNLLFNVDLILKKMYFTLTQWICFRWSNINEIVITYIVKSFFNISPVVIIYTYM